MVNLEVFRMNKIYSASIHNKQYLHSLHRWPITCKIKMTNFDLNFKDMDIVNFMTDKDDEIL